MDLAYDSNFLLKILQQAIVGTKKVNKKKSDVLEPSAPVDNSPMNGF